MADKKSWIHSGWTISVGTLLLGFLLTFAQDYFKDEPVFSTLWSCLKWCWNLLINILNFDIKVWWFIVGVIVLIVILYIINMFQEKEISRPDFCEYREDIFNTWKWTWSWAIRHSDHKWVINKLKVHCPKCDTPMEPRGYRFDCPRCGFFNQVNTPDPHNTELLILDNIRRKREATEKGQ